MNINNNNYSVMEFINMLNRKELTVNAEYQRGSGLWPDGAASYFIDTILSGYPFPKIYMYEDVNRRVSQIKKEIVDGQQRIRTILRFYNNDLVLKGDTTYSGQTFEELPDEVQNTFLTYPVSVDVIRNASTTQILQMFRRMNAYTLPLNEAEKRHSSFQGRFKWFINQFADNLNEFFTLFGVFTPRQIVRMGDAELLSEAILAIERGIVSTSATDLRQLYAIYDESFPTEHEYHEKLSATFRYITEELELLRHSHMMKPYALHSLVTALVHNRFEIPALTTTFRTRPLGRFSANSRNAAENLLALAQAHEAKEVEGPYATYVWGCLGGTNRAPRRIARVAGILRALGVDVPADIDANIA